DFTITDFVADLRAPTPSGAAELAVPDEAALQRNLEIYQQRLVSAVKRKVQNEQRLLQKIISNRVFLRPKAALLDARHQELDLLTERLVRCFKHDLNMQRERFHKIIGKLNALSPLATLERGYALAHRADGTLIKSSAQIATGEQIRVRLATGSLWCEVNQKENE
ncbi:MAG TPA: exodeoxyribonuclease VII large subunit, partial [Bacillota bacterium]|nr:exodeoxyribonuclease VII large subunit [Bacillota bacterium]